MIESLEADNMINSTAGTIATVNINYNYYFNNLYELFNFMIQHNITELCNGIICYRWIM